MHLVWSVHKWLTAGVNAPNTALKKNNWRVVRTQANANVVLSGLKDHPVNLVVCVPSKQVDVVDFPTANTGQRFESCIELCCTWILHTARCSPPSLAVWRGDVQTLLGGMLKLVWSGHSRCIEDILVHRLNYNPSKLDPDMIWLFPTYNEVERGLRLSVAVTGKQLKM